MNVRWVVLAALAVLAVGRSSPAQSGLANGGLEGEDGTAPPGWIVPPAMGEFGYVVALDGREPFSGRTAALVDATAVEPAPDRFGNLMQSLDAAPYRGKRVRFRAAVRTAELVADGRAQLWLRVDRGSGVMGAFDNMDDRPIRSDAWTRCEIVAAVEDDASRISVGLLVLGRGKAWIDDASFEVVSDATPTTAPARPSPFAGDDAPQPFVNGWLALALVATLLLLVSQTPLPEGAAVAPPEVGLFRRFALRFAAVYWLLYSLPQPFTALLGRPVAWYEASVDRVVRWTALHALGIERALVPPGGSGDTTFDYVRLLVVFAAALGLASVWSVLDRRRGDDRRLRDLLRSYVRYVLALTMLGYGLAKVGSIYNQFPEPHVDQLMRTYGASSPMNLAWTFMGASRPYTIFAGLGEVIGALLLVWRRTTTLGALVVIAVMANVVMLNFCYDIPVKQYSTHLVLMAVFLLVPDAGRLARVLVANRATGPVDLGAPYALGHARWARLAGKAVLVVVLILMPLRETLRREVDARGSVAAEPSVFGTWVVEEFRRGGEPVPPILTDGARWRTVTLQRVPWGTPDRPGPVDWLVVRTMSPDLQDAPAFGSIAALSGDGRTIRLESAAPGLPATLSVAAVDGGRLELSGMAGDREIRATLRRVRREDFLLVARGFRWINEYPYNR